jgi:carbon-monoxide dehydrogenase medium subunit
MQPFDYCEPSSLREALSLLAEHRERARVLAGGTDLFLRLRTGAVRPSVVLDLKRVPGLDGIRDTEAGGLRIGALTPHADLEASEAVRVRYPALALAARCVAGVQIRNRGTVGGNLCNASPAADLATPLLAFGALVRVAGPDWDREVPLETFFAGPGRTVLAANEILTEVVLPPPAAWTGSDFQRSVRTAVDIALVNVAVCLTLEAGDGQCREARMALGAVAPTPVLAPQAVAALRGQHLGPEAIAEAARRAATEARPITDVRATAEYRRDQVEVLVARALARAWEAARSR